MKTFSKLRSFLILSGVFTLLLPLAHCVYKTRLSIENTYHTKGPVIIENVSFFSGNPDDDIKENINILIDKGFIQKISKSTIINPEARIINGRGFQVLPGLVNLHTHLTSAGGPPWLTALGDPRSNLSAYLYAGVTMVMDLFGNRAELADLTDDLSKSNDNIATPGFIHAGKAFTAEGGHPAAVLNERIPWLFRSYIKGKLVYEVNIDSDIRTMVQENRDSGARVTKVFIDQIPMGVKTLDEQTIKKIVTESNKLGLPVIAHIGSEEDLLKALQAGVRLFAHGIYRSNLSSTTLELMASENAVMMPTAVVWQSIADLSRNRQQFNSLDQVVIDKKVMQSYKNPKKLDASFQKWVDNMLKFEEEKYQHIKRLHAAGVKLIVASDSPNVGVGPGSGIHREMELWVNRAGFTPRSAVSAATYVPGKLLEEKWSIKGHGYLKEGNVANLIVIQGDIRENISATRNITFVMLNGRLIQRKVF